MSHRLNITLSNEQYAWLDAEANRSSVSMSETIRRALDTVFGVHGERRVFAVTHATGRRPGLRLDRDPAYDFDA
jgi:hypothetical protein